MYTMFCIIGMQDSYPERRTTNCLSSYKPCKFLQAWIASFQFAQFDQYIATRHELKH